MSDTEETIGIWFGANEDLKERFDARFGRPADYSRSATVKDAMEMYLAIDDALEQANMEFTDERPKRAAVRQAILDMARAEAAEP
jgi:metal-responsive CopG/Arc/MetJ family transcriptional regulator